jgi:hypothetical protein
MNTPTHMLTTLVVLLAVGILAVGHEESRAAATSMIPRTAIAPLMQTESEATASPEPSDAKAADSGAAIDGPVLPVTANPISNTATAPGLKIAQVLVENNTDPATGKDAPDHLEIALQNDGQQELSNLEVYYEITDLTTGAKEGYYRKLEGFTIPAGGTRVVHFDNTGEKDHYPDNEFSLYHLSLNELQVDVMVSAAGVAPQIASVKKDAGGDENPDE